MFHLYENEFKMVISAIVAELGYLIINLDLGTEHITESNKSRARIEAIN